MSIAPFVKRVRPASLGPRLTDALGDIAPRLEPYFQPAQHPWPSAARTTAGASLPLADLAFALSGLELDALLPRALQNAVRHRQIAWIGGRLCAERALDRAGAPGQAVPRGDHGEPVWPAGVAGSITHTDITAHALVTRRADGAGLGIDSEHLVDADAQRAIAHVCCSPRERARWLEGIDSRLRTTLLFAAKEAIYKAAWPAVHRFIDFDEATALDWNDPAATIEFRLGPALADACAVAHYRIDEPGQAVHACVSLDEALIARLKALRS